MSSAMTLISSDERRSVLRWNVDTPIQVLNSDKTAVLGQVANLSQGGMMVVGDADLVPGTSYILWLEIPDVDDGVTVLRVQAVVVWSGYSETERRHSSGLNFHACPASLLAAVAHLVAVAPDRSRTVG